MSVSSVDSTSGIGGSTQTMAANPLPLNIGSTSVASPSLSGASSSSSTSVKDLPLIRRIWKICLWESPQVTGLTLISLALLTFLLQKGFTVLTLISYLLLLQLLTCLVFINASRAILRLKGQTSNAPIQSKSKSQAGATNTAPNSSADGSENNSIPVEYISEATLRSIVPVVHSTLNVLLHACMRLVRCSSNTATLKAVGVLAVLSMLGRLADGVTCLALVGLAALTMPKLYFLNQTAADKLFLQAMDALEKVTLVLGINKKKKQI
jgi:hypothetical protein